MTLAALEATLRLYLDPQAALQQIPTLRMLTEDASVVHERAEALMHALRKHVSARQAHLDIVEETGRAGGGSLPMCDIDTYCVRMEFKAGNAQPAKRTCSATAKCRSSGASNTNACCSTRAPSPKATSLKSPKPSGSYFATLPGAKEA